MKRLKKAGRQEMGEDGMRLKGRDGMGGKDGGWRMEGVRGVGWDKMEGVVRGQE